MLRPTSPSPPSGDDAQAAGRRASGGGPSSGCGWLTRASPAAREVLRAARPTSSSVGRRPAAAASARVGRCTPASCSAALAMIAPCDDAVMIARTTGSSRRWIVAGRRPGRRASTAATISAYSRRRHVADDADDADARRGSSQAQVERVVAGVEGEVGLGHHPRAVEQVALGVLDRDDARRARPARPASRSRSACRCGRGCRRASPAGRWRRRPSGSGASRPACGGLL